MSTLPDTCHPLWPVLGLGEDLRLALAEREIQCNTLGTGRVKGSLSSLLVKRYHPAITKFNFHEKVILLLYSQTRVFKGDTFSSVLGFFVPFQANILSLIRSGGRPVWVNTFVSYHVKMYALCYLCEHW